MPRAQSGQEDRPDAPLAGAIVVTAEVTDEEFAERVPTAFGKLDAESMMRADDST